MDSGTVISGVKGTPINVPLVAPYPTSAGVFPGFSKCVVEIETNDGAVGIGEAPNGNLAALIEQMIGPKLIGANPFDFADCERRGLPPVQAYRNTEDRAIVLAYGGVEMALWDLVGKLKKLSIAEMLGGRIRDEIEFTEYFAPRLRNGKYGGEESPCEVASYCAAMIEEHGANGFEGKVGVSDLGNEVDMVREVRAAVGEESMLRVDANMAWTLTQAREAVRRMDPFRVSSYEEPVRFAQEMARLRTSTAASFSSHDPDLRTAVRIGAPDAFVINLSVLGGIRRTVAFVNACEEMGFEVWFYSDPGIATAAYLQVSAAIGWLSSPHQTLSRWLADDVLERGPFIPKDGVLKVPDGDGLGVALDQGALKRCHDRFCDEGPYDQYQDGRSTRQFIR